MYAAVVGKGACIAAKERIQLHFQPSQPAGLIALLASSEFRI